MHAPETTLVVRFPHGAEVVPIRVHGRPVRFASIDRDGSLSAWIGSEAPELCDGCGVWVGRSDADLLVLGRVCTGTYPAYREALRAVCPR